MSEQNKKQELQDQAFNVVGITGRGEGLAKPVEGQAVYYVESGVEEDAPENMTIGVWIVLLTGIVAVSMLAVWAFTHWWSAGVVKQAWDKPDARLIALREYEKTELGKAAVADAAKQTYAIPIDQAMKAVVKNPRLLATMIPVTTTAAAVPADGIPAPTDGAATPAPSVQPGTP